MKKTMLLLATFVLMITTAIPSFGDGNPRPYCDKNGCQMPPSLADGNPRPYCDKNGCQMPPSKVANHLRIDC